MYITAHTVLYIAHINHLKANDHSCSVHHSNFGLNEHIIRSNLIAQLVEWQTSIPKGALVQILSELTVFLLIYISSERKSLNFLCYSVHVHTTG